MKLYDLIVGQRFEFVGKHRGKVFEVTIKGQHHLAYIDVATGQERLTYSNRLTFRMDVALVADDAIRRLSKREIDMLVQILHERYLYEAEIGGSETTKSEINRLYLKIKG